ncbi:MAG: hypothetical protein GY850_23745 [bacterium]|nr:hypothetical protein [bacterium]
MKTEYPENGESLTMRLNSVFVLLLFVYMFVLVSPAAEAAFDAACIKLADESTTGWDGCDVDAVSVLVFEVSSTALIEEPNKRERMLFRSRIARIEISHAEMDVFYTVLSEREQLEMRAFKMITEGKSSSRLRIPLYVMFSAKSINLFMVDGRGLYMKNPFTDAPVYLENIDYVKFKNFPMIPVPEVY